MSLFNWFTRGKKPQRAPRSEDIETDLSCATVPFGGLPAERSRSTPSGTGSAKENQAVRHLRREQLYGVIRQEMLNAGVLTSAYKFKVLSLDSRGGSNLVMLELPELLNGEVARLTAREHAISLQAKNQYGVVVTSVSGGSTKASRARRKRQCSHRPLCRCMTKLLISRSMPWSR